MIYESIARSHYLDIIAKRTVPKRKMGFEVPKPPTRDDFYVQPYAMPKTYL